MNQPKTTKKKRKENLSLRIGNAESEKEASDGREDTAEAGQPGDSEVFKVRKCTPCASLCTSHYHWLQINTTEIIDCNLQVKEEVEAKNADQKEANRSHKW